jgi:cephalosporin-C deacetylase
MRIGANFINLVFVFFCFNSYAISSENIPGANSYDTIPGQEIDRFWKETREELARVPMEAEVEAIKAALPYKQFKVTVKSLAGIRITGILSIPVQGEAPAMPWPVIITNPGYGIGAQQGVMLSECQRGYAILQVFPRGQGESGKFLNLDGVEKLTWNIDKPGEAYYRGAYADVMRMIDFVGTQKNLDSNRIALVGTSQGGGISLAVTALDPRVKAVVAHVPFLCNFRLAARTPNSLVKKILDKEQRNDEASLRTLDYFDPFQLAPKIFVPAMISAGGKDETCPLATIQSVYDRLSGEKTLKIYPELPHTSCLDFYNLSWSWLERNFKNRNRIN